MECTAGTEAKLIRQSWTCTACDGYGMQGGKCYECPKNADCTSRDDGFDVAANPGYFRGPPFFQTCISNNTRVVLEARGLWKDLEVGRNKEVGREGNKLFCESVSHVAPTYNVCLHTGSAFQAQPRTTAYRP